MREVLAALFGVVLILISLQDAFVVVLLPRPVQHRRLGVYYFFRISWAIWSKLGSRIPAGVGREGFLGIFGPLSMVILFVSWAACLIAGFGFLQWGIEPGIARPQWTLAACILASGDAFFTLGYQNLGPPSETYHLLNISEAGTGFGLVALAVSYLPVLYLHFSERDRQLINLGARAGSPPSAGTLLKRYSIESNPAAVNEWLRNWETWAAELVESHSSYPMLAFYRSQHENHSWLASLAVILDCCTLIATGADETTTLQAETTFAATRRVLVQITRALGVSTMPHKTRRRAGMLNTLEESAGRLDLRWSEKPAAESSIVALEQCYEPMLQGLSAYLLLPLPVWNLEDSWSNGSETNSAATRMIRAAAIETRARRPFFRLGRRVQKTPR